MGETPSTLQLIVLLVPLVLPGITCQVREWMRGPAPGERDLAERVLRAVTASIVLDAIYLIAVGPWLAQMIKPSGRPWFTRHGVAQGPA